MVEGNYCVFSCFHLGMRALQSDLQRADVHLPQEGEILLFY